MPSIAVPKISSLAIIIPELELRKLKTQVLLADVMECPDDPALENALEALTRVMHRQRLRQNVGCNLRKRLTPLIRKTQPYAKRIAHKGIWVEPQVSARTEAGPCLRPTWRDIRFPFKGIRDDL